MRDNDKARVYEAENTVERLLDSVSQSQVRTIQAFGSTLTLSDEVRFADLASMQRYVDRVLALDWVRATFPRAAWPVRVRASRGAKNAHYFLGEITIPLRGTHALRETWLLHELAHHLNAHDGEEASHGPSFVGTELLLVREIIGPEVGLLLTAAMHEAGVKIRPVNRVDRTAC